MPVVLEMDDTEDATEVIVRLGVLEKSINDETPRTEATEEVHTLLPVRPRSLACEEASNGTDTTTVLSEAVVEKPSPTSVMVVVPSAPCVLLANSVTNGVSTFNAEKPAPESKASLAALACGLVTELAFVTAEYAVAA